MSLEGGWRSSETISTKLDVLLIKYYYYIYLQAWKYIYRYYRIDTTTASSEQIFNGTSASAKGVQCCLALTPWRPFFSSPRLQLGTNTHKCAGELPPDPDGQWRSRTHFQVQPSQLSGFGNEHVPSTPVAMLFLYTRDSCYVCIKISRSHMLHEQCHVPEMMMGPQFNNNFIYHYHQGYVH